MNIITQDKTKSRVVNTNREVKLKPITAKGKQRYCYIGTLNPFIIVSTLLPLLSKDLEVDKKIVYALLSDRYNNSLTCKEICMLMNGIYATQYGSYVAIRDLEEDKINEYIKEYQAHRYKTHNARTSKAYKVKHLSDLIVNTVICLVDTPFRELYKKMVVETDKESFELLDEEYETPKRNCQELQDISDHWYLTLQRNNTPKVEKPTRLRREWASQTVTFRALLDDIEKEMDRALKVLEVMFPTVEGGQRDYIIDKLYKHYEEGVDVLGNTIEVKIEGDLGSREVVSGSKWNGMYEVLANTSYISTPFYPYFLTYSFYQTPPTPPLPTTKYHPPSEYTYNPYPCTTLPLTNTPTLSKFLLPFSTTSLINAYDYRLKNHPYVIHNYNTLALKLLSSYQPINDLEKRCKQVMIGTGKAFPLSYLRTSTCPRVYAEGKDNLFYCPTRMRQEICKDLGLREWDMKSCHTYILLGLYEKSFPILKEMIESNSIWKKYEEYFTSNNCIFNKQVVKAFHYATILGGGTNAYLEAIKKLEKEGVTLTEEEALQIINTYKKHPVVKEMKSFINKWAYKNKEVTYPNGESHKVIQAKSFFDTQTKKRVIDYSESNVLQVFSGLLRAWERVLISYVGLSHPEAFTILLHQHDGITVMEDSNDAFELAQEAMREISILCFPNLTKPIELEIKL